MKQYFKVVIFILSIFQLNAQDPFAVSINIEKGLPSNTVYDLFQDSKGFIWCTSNEGLSRYDGYEFINYSAKNQSSKSGSEIQEDAFGRIWYMNFDGFLFYVENGKLNSLRQNTPLGYARYGIVKNKLFVFQQKGIDIYNLKNLKREKTISIPLNELIEARCSNDKFYVHTRYIYSISTDGNVQRVNELNDWAQKVNYLVTQKNTLIGIKINEKEIIGYEFANGRKRNICTKILNTPTFIQKICVTGQKEIWFCTTKGATIFQEKNQRNNFKTYFSNKNISCTIKDIEGNYWFGSLTDGLIFVPNINFKSHFSEIKPYKLECVKNNLYIGTSEDKIYVSEIGKWSKKIVFQGKDNHEVYLLKHDSFTNQLFFTSKLFGTLKQDNTIALNLFATKDLKRIDNRFMAICISGYFGIYDLGPGKNSNWLNLYNRHKLFNQPLPVAPLINAVRAKSVVVMKQSSTLLISTNIGLFKLNYKGERRELKYKGNHFYSSKLVTNGKLTWALTPHGEIYEIDENGKITELTKKWKLENISIRNFEVIKGVFYGYSDNFLFRKRINSQRKTEKIALFGATLTDIKKWKQQLVLASNKGILFCNENQLFSKRIVPKIVINHTSINGREFDYKTFQNFESFENTIDLNFSILSFSTNGDYPVEYRVNEGKWISVSTKIRELNLASLAFGKYDLQLRIKDHKEVLHVRFNIVTPWFKSIWFSVIWVSALFLLIITYLKWQITTLKKRNELLSEKIKLEENLTKSILKSIKSQMNPHFFYNALNTIQSFIFLDDKKNATSYLSKFSKLTRMILEMSEKEKVSLNEEITALTLYFEIEKVRFNNDFTFQLNVDQQIDKDLISIPSMIVQPYVENAVKHGLLHKKNEKSLIVSFEKKDSNLQITIDDNGIGRQRSAELNYIKNEKHNSFSTQANQQRLELLNKGRNGNMAVQFIDKMDQNGNPIGTTVILSIPI